MAEDVCADSAVTHATETDALKCSSKKITASELHSTLDKVVAREPDIQRKIEIYMDVQSSVTSLHM